MSDAEAHGSHIQGPQESPRIAMRPIVWIGAFLAAFVAASMVLLAYLFRLQMGVLPTSGPAPPPRITLPEPRLQVHAPRDLARLRHEEDLALGPKAALPIDKAMAVVAGRGRDAYAPFVPEQPATQEAKP